MPQRDLKKNPFQKEDQVKDLLVNFLKVRERSVQDYELRLCLEDQGVRFDLEEDRVKSDLQNQLPEGANSREREEGRLELWSQVLWENVQADLRDRWYLVAKSKEELESLLE